MIKTAYKMEISILYPKNRGLLMNITWSVLRTPKLASSTVSNNQNTNTPWLHKKSNSTCPYLKFSQWW